MSKFSPYQKFVVAMLAFLQFTIVLDFMILSPLGAILIPKLGITPAKFGLVVSAYAFSAGASGLLAAGFADRFDRKKLLLFFYTGFLLGTLFCGLATTYEALLAARMVTGVFGGVIGSIVMAIITDLFPMNLRGSVMGIVQTAFAVAQVAGIPIGIALATRWDWHAPFLMIVGVGVAAGALIVARLKPVRDHLKLRSDKSPFRHLATTVSQRRYLLAFGATALLSTGGFMIMPFASAFNVQNMGIPVEKLPLIYMCTGVFSMLLGPVIGRLSDTYGKFKAFCAGTVIGVVMVTIYTHRGITPLIGVIAISVIMFIGISARMISASALVSGVPKPADRGAFMSVNASLSQISGGISAAVAGLVVAQAADGRLEHFEILGYIVVGIMLFMVFMMYQVDRMVRRGGAASA